MKDADEFYKPLIKEHISIDGVAAESADAGMEVSVIQRGFTTSFQPYFTKIADDLMKICALPINDSINEVLIIIKKDNTAKIYLKFPMILQSRVKKNITYNANAVVYSEDIFDIGEIEFRDSIYEIKIEKEDKIIFLFRVHWKFGVFFDFTKDMDLEQLKKDLAYYYKRLYFYDLYSFIENEKNFDDLTNDGWFPFIQLIGKKFDKIMQYYKEEKKYNFQIDKLISEFNKDKLESFTQYWWEKEAFKDKKEILESGINAFLQNDKNGFIACIHTLYPQIEGIIGHEYLKSHGKKLSSKELVQYIQQKAESKFNTASSTGFPKEFYTYLEKTVFKDFHSITGEIDLSRHSASHGYANANDFTRAKALQAILILDQIYFYI